MGLSAGIVGLPNVGKSSLFNTITNSQVEAANYPFATIQPNMGVVKVPDPRLTQLGALINPDKLTPAMCSFVDIAGLVKGASNGEGLGNQFLANIRENDVICHVIRCFSDKSITHYYDRVDPISDCEIINLELIYADLQCLEKKYPKVSSSARSGNKDSIIEEVLIKELMSILKQAKFIDVNKYSDKEKEFIKLYNLLTTKPVLYICNIDESDITEPENNENYKKFSDFIKKQNSTSQIIPLAITMEYEISKLSDEEKSAFLLDLGIKEAGLDTLINAVYKLLGIQTFFTFGKDETRAWSFKKNSTAPTCAGIIHSDIEKGFIRAEVMNCNDLISLRSEQAVKDAGKLRIEGKDYIVQDGDVCYFRFNVSNNKK